MGYVSRNKAGIMLLLLTAMIWGFSFIAQVLGSHELPAFGFNGIRFLLGGLSMLPLCLIKERSSKLPPKESENRIKSHRLTIVAALLAGCALFGASTLQQCGITLIKDPGKAGFITGLYTVLTPIAYWLIFKKKSSWNVWLGCVLAAGGLYLICLKENFEPHIGLGELLILAGAFIWTAHILIVDRFSSAVYTFRFSTLQYFFCGFSSLMISFLTEKMTWTDIANGMGAIFVCGVLSVGVAFTLQTVGQRMVRPAPAAIILSTEAVFAVLGSVLWNLLVPEHLQVEQTITGLGAVGCVAMFLGIVLSQITFKPRQKQTDLPQ